MDLITLLRDNRIEFWESGKNVSIGYIGLRCFYCDDESNHLGIRLKDLKVTCWKCGPHNTIKTFQLLLKTSYIDAKAIVENLSGDLSEKYFKDRKPSDKIVFPYGFTTAFPKIFKDYLRRRNFNVRELIKKYKLMTCYRFGEYAYRIIIPVFKDGLLVSWTARDVTDLAPSKYKAAKIEESLIRPETLIYNFDSVREGGDAILVEGPFDCFRIGDGSFCFFGIKHNDARIKQIIKKNIRRLYIFFDNDPNNAGREASKYIMNIIRPHVKEASYLRLKQYKDPGDLPPDVVTRLKYDLEFKE